MPKSKYRTGLIITEVILGFAIAYYLCGGYKWSPLVWLAWTVFAGWVIQRNLKWYRNKTEE